MTNDDMDWLWPGRGQMGCGWRLRRGLCRRSRAGKEDLHAFQQSDVKLIGLLLDFQNVDVVKLYQNVDHLNGETEAENEKPLSTHSHHHPIDDSTTLSVLDIARTRIRSRIRMISMMRSMLVRTWIWSRTRTLDRMRQQHRILKSGESYPERHIGGGIKYFSIVHAEHRQKTKDQHETNKIVESTMWINGSPPPRRSIIPKISISQK